MTRLTRRNFLVHTAALVSTGVLTQCTEEYHTEEYHPLSAHPAAAIKESITLYPPAQTGLRGDTDNSRIAPHSVALHHKTITMPHTAQEDYDLVVVGSGISGLVAAYCFQKIRPEAKILIVDNHDDFGGHAKRNEFTVNGKTLITYGGSENLDAPNGTYSSQTKQFLQDLGVDYHKFEQYFQKDLYRSWGLSKGIFFSQNYFGQSKVVHQQPERDNEKAREIIAQFPLSDEDKQTLTQLYLSPPDYFKGKSRRQREALALSISYYDFLVDYAKVSQGCIDYLQNLSSDYWGHDIRAVSLAEAWEFLYPGMQNCRLEPANNEHSEPYIYHFPDGNASITRLIVRKLIPSALSGNTMEDIVMAKLDYHSLDKAENHVRIRLNTSALRIENLDNHTVAIALQSKDGKLYRVNASKCIYAGHAALAQRIMPQMPQKQQEAMLTNVKVPMLYTKVALKNGHAFKKLGVYWVYCPNQPYCEIMLDFPVKMGDYVPAQSPDEPIILHCIRIATSLEGKTARDKYRQGRRHLMTQNETQLREEIMQQLRELFALVGENADDIVVDISINRWAHGYSYERLDLFDSDKSVKDNTTSMQQTLGNIFMANTDMLWKPYLQYGIEQGMQAAQQALA